MYNRMYKFVAERRMWRKAAFVVVAPLFLACYSISFAASKPCSAVDTLAEIFYSKNDVESVGVYGDEDEKRCQFSINGATSDAADPAVLTGISASREKLRYLRRYAEGRLTTPEASRFSDVVASAVWDFLDLLAAPRLRDGTLPNSLVQVWEENAKLVEACIFDFYSNETPEHQEGSYSCMQIGDSVLSLKVEVGSFYELLIFR